MLSRGLRLTELTPRVFGLSCSVEETFSATPANWLVFEYMTALHVGMLTLYLPSAYNFLLLTSFPTKPSGFSRQNCNTCRVPSGVPSDARPCPEPLPGPGGGGSRTDPGVRRTGYELRGPARGRGLDEAHREAGACGVSVIEVRNPTL